MAGLLVLAGVAARTVSTVILRPRSKPSVERSSVAVLTPAVRSLHAAALGLAGSVLGDSAVEHDRGSYRNPGMLAPLLSSAVLMLGAADGLRNPGPRPWRRRAARTAIAVGAAGTGFHLVNLLGRPGKLNWQNLFYGAPLGAPAALALAGLAGEAAEALARAPAPDAVRLAGVPAGEALAALACVGLAGTSAEAALLHFRGSFHNPLMALPVSLPPLAAALLARVALARGRAPSVRAARGALAATALLGPAGAGLHAYGVSRAMGGWRNWTQNVVAGPPLAAPPAYSALAVIGLAALALLEAARRQPR